MTSIFVRSFASRKTAVFLLCALICFLFPALASLLDPPPFLHSGSGFWLGCGSGVWGLGSGIGVWGLRPGFGGLGIWRSGGLGVGESGVWFFFHFLFFLSSGVWGLESGVWGLGSGVRGLGSGVRGPGSVVWGLASGVWGRFFFFLFFLFLGSGVWGLWSVVWGFSSFFFIFFPFFPFPLGKRKPEYKNSMPQKRSRYPQKNRKNAY